MKGVSIIIAKHRTRTPPEDKEEATQFDAQEVVSLAAELEEISLHKVA